MRTQLKSQVVTDLLRREALLGFEELFLRVVHLERIYLGEHVTDLWPEYRFLDV